MISKCFGCLKHRELCKSHAIPNSSFKRIFRTNSGKAHISSPHGSHLNHTSDSGAGFLLCSECETYLNTKFDQPTQTILQHIKCGKNLLPPRDAETFPGFMISVIWRASNLASELYKDIELPEDMNELCHGAIFSESSRELLKSFSFRLSVLHDDYIDFQQVVLIPSVALHERKFELYFAMDGFLMSVFAPPFRKIDANKHGLIRNGKPFHVKKILANTHPVFDALVRAHLQLST